ncbi:SusC/RagA family TonB-linked outer membrane protein [Niastella caeni]|uniref:SusC/RagA family TonB-linked outer membrane protein n=1 Tax=Niastella caeni TaxID=2569763 RepID=A0A4S8HZ11_9BACT|nr:SusC/RagA family TonB-linked outer membrane protein [Niastella caeni]THU40920.1 SusC/RagA family TonB-linked outer membrane protein [Niastella caeni]
MRKFQLMLGFVMLLCMQLRAQQRNITGKVIDGSGNPIPNASVIIKETNAGTSTLNDGTYSITISPQSKTIIFSAVGMQPTSFSIGNKGVINVTMEASDKNLSEVVVVGYGTQKKATTTAAIVKVGGDKLENRPLVSVDQMLQGAAAGLQSTASTGQPGANQGVRIRGIGSFSYGGSQPLYVVDGVQINSGDLSNGNGVGTSGTGSFSINPSTNVLATINANDIESITVLKDAAATSIYGSRGSNGVIIITTKSGKQGKAQFRFDAESGNNKVIPLPDAGKPLRASDWLMLLRESLVNEGKLTSQEIDKQLHDYGDTSGVDTDWLNLIQRTGTQQQYNVSATGGEGKLKYFLSGGYFKQQGTTIGTDLKRYTGNLKISYAVTDKLTLSTKITIGNVRQNSALASSGTTGGGGYFGNPTYAALTLRPTQNPFNANGTYNISPTVSGFPSHYNPLFIAKNDKRWLKAVQGLVNQSLEYKIITGLKFTSTLGLQYATNEEYQFNNPFHGDAAGASGEGISLYSRNFLWDWINQLDYHYDIWKDKKLYADLKVGHESIKNSYYRQIGDVTGFPPNADLYYSTNGATSTNGKAVGEDYSFEGYYSNVNISLDDKYNLYGSYRRDASSRFSLNNRWGSFASVGASWNASNEDFFQPLLSVVSNLKLRASYGNNGNAEIPNYAWRQTYGYGYNYNGVAGGRFDNIGNSELTWEKNKQLDLGVDISFLRNRLNISFDYYKRITDDALLGQQISRTTGFLNFINNIGDMENKGYELTVNAMPVQTKDFAWEINFNITHNTNKVTSLPAGNQPSPQNSLFYLSEGKSLYSYFNRGWAGVDPEDGAAMWYKDSSKTTTTKSRAEAGLFFVGKNADPKYFGSLGNTLTYKNISLSFDFYYNYGNYIMEAYMQYFMDGSYATRGKYAINMNRWQKKGDVTNVPKYTFGVLNTSSGSDRLLFKGDYIRLRNVQMGYRLNSKTILDKLHLSSLSVYARGTNLWTKTYDDQLLNDPEQGILGINQQAVRPSRSYTVGVNIGF